MMVVTQLTPTVLLLFLVSSSSSFFAPSLSRSPFSPKSLESKYGVIPSPPPFSSTSNYSSLSPFLFRRRRATKVPVTAMKASPKNNSNNKRREESGTNLKLKTYDNYRDKLEALSFLIHYHNHNNNDDDDDVNSNTDQQEFCREAQTVFDKMYNEWYMNDNDNLEPTTEIYNLLIDIYSNTNQGTSNSNKKSQGKKNKNKNAQFGTSSTMEIPEQILDQMEQSFKSIVGNDENDDLNDDGSGNNDIHNQDVPLPNEETYILMIKGYSNSHNNNNMLMVEQMLDRFEQRCEEEFKMKFRRQQQREQEEQTRNDNIDDNDNDTNGSNEAHEDSNDEILIQPTIEIYNSVLSAWLKSGYRCKAKKAEDILYKLMDSGMVITKVPPSISSVDGDASLSTPSSIENMAATRTTKIKVIPNTKTFYLVMSCFVRDKTLSRAQKEHKINQLVDFMKEYQKMNNNPNQTTSAEDVNSDVGIDIGIDIDADHHRIKNVRIKVSKTPMDAESILFEMIDLYQKSDIIDHRPNAASFINTILLWKDSITTSNKKRRNNGTVSSSSSVSSPEDVSATATERSLQLLDLLTEMYKLEHIAGKDVEDLKPDVRVYNAVQSVFMRSIVKNKARETKKLLLNLISLCYKKDDEGGKGENGETIGIDEDYIPKIRQWNNVLNSCVYTTGNQIEKKEAMKILVETFNEMRVGAISTPPTSAAADGEEEYNQKLVVEPNHITYGMFLKGCANLLPPGEKQKQQAIVEKVFRKCCREGHMSEFVFTTFVDTASPELCRQILGGDVSNNDVIQIPEEWTRNV